MMKLRLLFCLSLAAQGCAQEHPPSSHQSTLPTHPRFKPKSPPPNRSLSRPHRDPGPPPRNLQVSFLDVGQADAILIQIDDVDILVDTGRPSAFHSLLDEALETVVGELDLLLITHPHIDHYGGAESILRTLPIGRLITNGEGRGPPRDDHGRVTWSEFVDMASRAEVPLTTVPTGTVLTPAEGLTLTFLASGNSFPDTPWGPDINNDSLVVRLEYAGRRVLLTGDLETEGQSQLLQTYCLSTGPCPSLKADVLKVPHHGSMSYSPAFFKAVAPRYGVISAAFDKPFGNHFLPRATTISALRDLGVEIFSTSAEPLESIDLTITEAGDLEWLVPDSPLFYWTCRPSSRCVGTLDPAP